MSWTGEVSRALASGSAGLGALRVPTSAWSVEDSGELYRISDWGFPYFSIDAGGHVVVRGDPGNSASVCLSAVVREARRRRVEFPLMIRFPDILRAQVARLNREFRAAVTRTGYGNGFTGLYPIKVNPLRHVMTEILDAGRAYGMGLECGSRSELAAALPHLREGPDLLVCNGVKDESMLALAIDAQRLGKQVIPVVESPEEFAALRTVAANRGVRPDLGVRIRLPGGFTPQRDRYAAPDSKFGLSIADLMVLLKQFPDILRQLRLLHFHPGSQVGDLVVLERAAREAAQVWASLVQRGAGLRYLDVGGGLGVNYGDAGGDCGSGLNYSMADYAQTVVAAVNDVCRDRQVPVPVLVSESGRAVTAQHAVLIVPIRSVRARRELAAETALPPQACDSTAMLVRWARHNRGPWDAEKALAALDSVYDRYRDCNVRFAQGRVPLEEYAVAERAFVTASRRILESLGRAGVHLPARFKTLSNSLVDRILCDFSVFHSLPDHWATGQAFPVMPVDRLNERPSRRGVLVDLTCDSDGRVSRYVSSDSDASVLPMHAPRPGVPADLGFFLMGAYEDVLGSAHNLLGRVSEIHIRLDDGAGEGFRIDRVVPATSVADMLTQMGYSQGDLRRSMGELVDSRVAAGRIPPQSGRGMLRRYAAYLRRGTYCGSGSGVVPKP